jgi:acyl-CoA synthetase (AMP-forming)/AMP-acid ligase II
VADGSTRLTYRQLGQLAHALARRLEDTGINRTDPVALYSDNCPEYVVALLAAWTVGAAVTPIDPQLTAAEVRTRLTAVSAAAVLLPQRLGGSYPADTAATSAWAIEVAADGSTVDLTAIRSSGAAEPATPRLGRKGGRVQDLDAALLLFTTGSTGTPKIVPLTHANLAASVAGIRSRYHLGPDDATLVIMPLFHGHGLIAGLLATLASSGAAYLPAVGRFSAHRFWDEIANAKATWYTAVPTVHQILLARAAGEYPAPRESSRVAFHPQQQRAARAGDFAPDRGTVRRADDRRLRYDRDRAPGRLQPAAARRGPQRRLRRPGLRPADQHHHRRRQPGR